MAHQLIGYYTIADDKDKTLKVLRSYQYFAASKISDITHKTNWDTHQHRGGYVWHTTGSGKTMTSFKSAQLIANSGDADKVVFLLDRIELSVQSLDEYRGFAGEDEAIQDTQNTAILLSKLKSTDNDDRLIVTSIQKMSNIKAGKDISQDDIDLIDRKRLVFIIDECHRSVFGDMLTNPGTLTFWAIVAIVISFGACGFGLEKGIEKVTKVMMIALLLLMIALAVNSAFLPNAAAGIKFYLVPDFGEVAKKGFGNAVFAAMSQAFFTLSIGIGSMEIFGSYLDRKKRITGEAVNIVLLDTFVALMAGFIIIPVCFAYGVEPGSGPSLLFITLPTLFNNMAGGRIWGTLFFIFMSFAALSTIIAVFEEILAFFMDIGGWSRKKAVGVNFVLITVLSLPAILGFNVLSGIQPLGEGSNIMDMEDFLVSSNLLPLGSLVFVLFCVRKNGWGFENFLKEANEGEGIKFPHWIRLYMQYILPLIVVIIYLKGYYDMFSGKSTAVFVSWMCFAVLLLFVIFGVSIFTGRKKTGKVK